MAVLAQGVQGEAGLEPFLGTPRAQTHREGAFGRAALLHLSVMASPRVIDPGLCSPHSCAGECCSAHRSLGLGKRCGKRQS